MAEKTPNQQLAEKLLFKPAYVGDKSAAVKQEAHAFAEGYKKFLDAGKTEREVAAESEQMLKEAGYQQFDPKKTYAPGDKVYFSQLLVWSFFCHRISPAFLFSYTCYLSKTRRFLACRFFFIG